MKNENIVVFYDGGCSLCGQEIRHYKKLDNAKKINWIDINIQPESLEKYHISYKAAFAQLHVIDTSGQVQIGVYAFLTLWEQLPVYRHLAKAIKLLFLTKALNRLYAIFARWRLRRRALNTSCQTK